jgi:hypothetical protein
MAAFNRILNLLTLVAAIVALGYTVVLHERRVELREHSETLAATVADVSVALSENSGTTQHERLTEDGLNWQRFHDLRNPQTGDYAAFQKVLDQALVQADALRQQRDMLAQTLASVGERFEVDGANAENLQMLADSAESAASMIEKLNAVDRRDRNTARAIAALSRDIGHDLNTEAILDVEQSEAQLDALASHVRELDTRSAQLAETMAQIVNKIDNHQFETNPEQLRGANYATELTALLNDFESINESLADFASAKAEIIEFEARNEELLIALEDSNHTVDSLQITTVNLKADVDYWKGQATRPPAIGGGGIGPIRTTASVLDVNYDWNYIIIDLGAADKLQPTTELTVAREDQFVCNVRVSKVYDNHAVAEVLPKLRQGEVLAGDRVLF